MSAALDAHCSLMAIAREARMIRTIAGRAYPVREGELRAYELRQAEEHKRRQINAALAMRAELARIFA